MAQLNLFTSDNPMLTYWGDGPKNKTCNDCLYCYTDHNCSLREVNDHSSKFKACGRFCQVVKRYKMPTW